ncbi:toxin Cry1Ac domain D-VI-related protein, partial [Listeria booriae]|uniref:toxin Cry1Ac domain D-VI-related protein n=1 Tax=Listeria booriae TaxID=1552123 RepID=UPI0017FC475C
MKKKQVKQLVSVLTVASILGTSIVTPFNVLSEQLVEAAVSPTAPTYVAPAQPRPLEVEPGPFLKMVRFDGTHITLNLIKTARNYGVRVTLPNGTVRNFYSQYAAGARDEFVSIDVTNQNLTNPSTFFSTEGLYPNGNLYPNSYHRFYTAPYTGYKYDTAFGQSVYNLFQNSSLTSIGSGITQAEIDAAKSASTNAPASPEKDRLLTLITNAQTEFTNNVNAQNKAARDAVNELFVNNTPQSQSIKITTSQTTINAARALVDKVTDNTQKTIMLADIQKAQDLLNAREAEQARQTAARQAVNELFTNNNPTANTIKGTTTQASINAAKALVDKVTNSSVKATLEADIKKAQELLDIRTTAEAEQARQTAARQAVNELFTNNNPTANTIKGTTTQASINAAKALVDKVTNSSVKATLEADIKKA